MRGTCGALPLKHNHQVQLIVVERVAYFGPGYKVGRLWIRCRPRRAGRCRRYAVMENLDKQQIAMLRKAFDSFDTEKKGCIGTDMVGPILEMFGQKVSGNALKEVIAEADADGSGELEFEEFANLAAKFMVEEDTSMMRDELRQAFLLFDREGNGYITTEQLREILWELDNTITASDMDNIIEEIDADGSGTVDFEEFMAVMCGDD